MNNQPIFVERASNRKGYNTMAQLIIIARNDQPERESSFPETWLLHKENNTIEVQVMHDRLKRPFVRNKSAA